MSAGWALLVRPGRDIASAAAHAQHPVTTVVSTVADGLALLVSGAVAGLLVSHFAELAGVVEEVATVPARGDRPTVLTPSERPTNQRPYERPQRRTQRVPR